MTVTATAPRGLDADQRAVIDALRGAVDLSGMTQRAFASAVGTSASRLSAYLNGATTPSAALLMKFIRIASALAATRAEHVPTAIDFASSIRSGLARSTRPSRILRTVLEARDRLRDTLAHRTHLIGAWDAKATTGDHRWDTLLAAVIEHEFQTAGLPAPAWTQTARLDVMPSQVVQPGDGCGLPDC